MGEAVLDEAVLDKADCAIYRHPRAASGRGGYSLSFFSLDGPQGRARRQRGGGLGWARSVQGIVPTTLAAISVRSAGSQARTVPA